MSFLHVVPTFRPAGRLFPSAFDICCHSMWAHVGRMQSQEQTDTAPLCEWTRCLTVSPAASITWSPLQVLNPRPSLCPLLRSPHPAHPRAQHSARGPGVASGMLPDCPRQRPSDRSYRTARGCHRESARFTTRSRDRQPKNSSSCITSWEQPFSGGPVV